MEETKWISSCAKDLRELCKEFGPFAIPSYQRGYEWDAYNVQRLVYSVYDGEEVDTFLGTIQVSVEGKTDEEKTIQIVDGRQRLTTLALLYAVCCRKLGIQPTNDVLTKVKDPDLSETIAMIFDSSQRIDPFGTIGNKGDVTRLTQRGKEEARNAGSIYWRNSRYIYTILTTEHFGGLDANRLEKMFETVFFIVVQIQNQEMTQVIRIFDTLNSTGQALSDEAMFKIRYHSYLRGVDKTKNSTEIMDGINSVYRMVSDYNANKGSRLIEISMRDVLWSFRTFVIMKHSGEDLFDSSDMVLGTLSFFETIFKKDEVFRETLSLESFKTFVGFHIEYYRTFYSHSSLSQINDSVGAIKRMLPDLFAWTRYSSCWAIPIAAYAFYRENENDICSSYELATSKSLWVFQLLYFYSLVYQKGIKSVKTTLVRESFKIFLGENVGKFCNDKILEAEGNRKKWEYKSFWNCARCDLYNSYGQAYLLLSILEAAEGIKRKRDFECVLQAVFPWERSVKRPQIEHIYAQSIFSECKDLSPEEKSEFNGLGNFVLLEESINKNALKDKHPTLKLRGDGGKTFFSDSHMALVESLRELDEDARLDDARYWLMQVVRKRFLESKETLVTLLPLLGLIE